MPPIVSVLYYHEWPKVLLHGLRANGFDNKIIWVNHLPDNDVRDEYLDHNTVVVENPNGINAGGHGGGIDVGYAYVKGLSESHFLHIEPDCTVDGRGWWEDMEAMPKDTELAGPCTLACGLLHPCVSLWKVDAVRHSFTIQPKVQMPDPEYFDHYGQIKWLTEYEMRPLGIWMATAFWDCGIKNAYEAKRRSKSFTTSWRGITHHWDGRLKPIPHLSAH